MLNAQGSGVLHFLYRLWRAARWPLAALVLLFIALVIYRIPAAQQQQKSAETVAKIEAAHLTMADADGTHLPPPPDPAQVNATVAGVDANGNGIRDDVELAIFAKYPGAANLAVRAAELQYAMTEQMFLTDVFDTATWKAVAEMNSRADDCIIAIDQSNATTLRKDIESLVMNTRQREDAQTAAFEYITSHGSANGPHCDISPPTG